MVTKNKASGNWPRNEGNALIITIGASKSGGKTSTAIHFASVLHDQGKDVCVLDLDRQNNSAVDWALNNALPFPVFSHDTAEQTDRYAYTLVDTGAGLHVEDMAAIADDSDLLIIPTFPGVLNIRVLFKAARTEALEKLKTPAFVLLTNCPPRPSKDCEVAKDALTQLGFIVLDSTIRRSLWLDRAALEGVTVDQVPGGGASARNVYRDYESALWEVLSYERG